MRKDARTNERRSNGVKMVKVQVVYPTQQDLYDRALAAIQKLKPEGIGCRNDPANEFWMQLEVYLSCYTPKATARLKQQADDDKLAFDHADEIVGRLEADLSASQQALREMTENRDLWKHAHDADCPNKSALDEARKILAAMVNDEAFADLCAGIGEDPLWLKDARAALAPLSPAREAKE